MHGRAQPGQPFQHDGTTYEWDVPEGVFHPGVNQLTIAISGRVGRKVAVEFVDVGLMSRTD